MDAMSGSMPRGVEMDLRELLETLEEKKVDGPADVDVAGLAYDSRNVSEGFCFFCIKGLVTDGHRYVKQAVSGGATVIFVEREPDDDPGAGVTVVRVGDTRLALAKCSARFYGYPSDGMKLVGVTGTNGKTTTTFLIESILLEDGSTTGLIGTVENHVAGEVEPVTRTTPESLDLQRLLSRMTEARVDSTVMEVSSHALELHRVAGCHYNAVVFTNLTQDHLDFHISLEEYFGAKRKLFEGDDFGAGRKAVVNIDDPFGRRMLTETSLEPVSFAIDAEADIKASGVTISADGNSFEMKYGDELLPIGTKLQGRFNVYNCLSAAAAAYALGIPAASVKRGLESLAGVPGRFENIDCGQGFTALVDYAHTPDGISNLLEACREVTSGRVIIVVGCGGDRDRSKRPLMGGVASRLADMCIITSDNPRGEDPRSIIDMVLEGVAGSPGDGTCEVEVDRRAAILRACTIARAGDLVVVAGKGHESGQVFSDRVVSFDDRQVMRECLREVAGEESQP